MKFAYADPPYMGCGHRYKEHPEAMVYDTIHGHALLLQRLQDEYPDGWAYSCNSGDIARVSQYVNVNHRVMCWAKSFAVFKPNVGLAYTWEPVFISGGRKIERSQPTVKDHLVCPITLKKGLCGAKPEKFCKWILDALNFQNSDTLDDLFPGTGIMGRCVEDRIAPTGAAT